MDQFRAAMRNDWPFWTESIAWAIRSSRRRPLKMIHLISCKVQIWKPRKNGDLVAFCRRKRRKKTSIGFSMSARDQSHQLYGPTESQGGSLISPRGLTPVNKLLFYPNLTLFYLGHLPVSPLLSDANQARLRHAQGMLRVCSGMLRNAQECSGICSWRCAQ
jgi:hypothetical protein